jgi:hypothetical protein
MSANSGDMNIVVGSSQSCTPFVFETKNNQIAAQRWARIVGVATVFILLIACVVLLARPVSTILGESPVKSIVKSGTAETGINAGGIWIHDEFQPKKVWFDDSGSIHSPAERAVEAARKQAMHVSTLIMEKR